MERIVGYKIEKSAFPEENKTHLIVRNCITPHGMGFGRVFKGTYKECQEELKKLNKKLEEQKNGK